MTVFYRYLRLLSVAAMVCLSAWSYGQESMPPDSNVSTETDPNAAPAPEEPKPKPYERFKLNVDTITNLVTYKAIVDQSETGADSFYVRAKKWADQKYSLAKNKKMVLLDKPNEKLVLRTRFEAYTSNNKYSKNNIGFINFTLTLIFKDDKYKYIIDNIVYEPYQDPELVKSMKPEQYEGVTYFEYYLTTKYKVRDTDNMLRCSDQEFQNLITEIKKFLKNPIQVDEDDF